MNLTAEEICMLAELERKMDSGEAPYVIVEGCSQRSALTQGDMSLFGLQTGQTVSNALWVAILKFKIEQIQRTLAHQQVDEILKEFTEDSQKTS